MMSIFFLMLSYLMKQLHTQKVVCVLFLLMQCKSTFILGQKDACLRKEINSPKIEHNQNEEKKDLEDWLDDILND